MAVEISSNSFELLLNALNADDRERAGARYNELRGNLVKLFTWRSCPGEAETHADETLNRAAAKLASGEKIEDISGYAFGIARLLIMEINRREIRYQQALAELPHQPQPSESETRAQEIRLDCLADCLHDLSAAERVFFQKYFGAERGEKIENRKKLQAQFALTGSAMRMKALRLRERLENCVRVCAGEKDVS